MPTVQIINATANTIATNLRVAAYCRVSSDSDDQLNSYANQVQYFNDYIGKHESWQLVDVYADEAITGTRADKRPEFQRLLKDCRRGKVDKVVAKSISRFSRNTKDCLTCLRELKALGVDVYFEKEQLDTGSVSGEMLFSFYGSMAQEESMSISGNMRWSYLRRMRSGEFITCFAPYGYRLVNGNLVINEDEAKIVRRIFDEYLVGRSMAKIATELNADKIPKRNYIWTTESLRNMIRNERYTGNAILQKKYTTSEFPFRELVNKGDVPMYYVENSHPAIISIAVFKAAQNLREKRSVNDVPNSTYAFSGKIKCVGVINLIAERLDVEKHIGSALSTSKVNPSAPTSKSPKHTFKHPSSECGTNSARIVTKSSHQC